MNKFNVKINDSVTIDCYRIKNDINGNPRYLIHFLALSENYDNPKFLKLGLKKYRGKDFGGGIVLSSYSLENELKEIYKQFKGV